MGGVARPGRRALATALVLALGCGESGDVDGDAWTPETLGDTGDGGEADGSTTGGDSGGQGDDPSDTDGGTSGGGTGDDAGDGGETSVGDETGGGDTGGGENEVCYPGADRSWTTCLPIDVLDPPPAGYEYPPALGGNANYRPPIAFLDLEQIDPATQLAPNFRLEEVAQLHKGRWAVVQPHAIAAIQDLRDEVGPLQVNSAYRSPEYNAGIGGATHSRHMFGDGFDLDPVDVTITALEQACTAHGGFLVEYDTHVHCDWRMDPVDERFFGSPAGYGPFEGIDTLPVDPDRDL